MIINTNNSGRHLIFGIITFWLIFPGNVTAQINGCTDIAANNYNPLATQNDGSCTYSLVTVTPVSSVPLTNILEETSGLLFWNNSLVTHNDNSDLKLYFLDTITGAILNSTLLNGVLNTDWEEISQDSNFIYVGDFGNNANGNRTDLKIFRIDKNSIINNQPIIDTIHFSYSDQLNFLPAGANNTDYDCEAFIVSSDSIYLFTKQWISNGTNVYVMPKNPGSHIAEFSEAFNVQGLVTGATFMENQKLVVLNGYTNLLQPFIYCLYDFDSSRFFSGNKRRINLALPFHQIEGIATNDGLKYYLTNEYFTQPPIITTPQKLHAIDLNPYLSDYLSALTSMTDGLPISKIAEVFPNPVYDKLYVNLNTYSELKKFTLEDLSGKVVLSGELRPGQNTINVTDVIPGIYVIQIGKEFSKTVSIL